MDATRDLLWFKLADYYRLSATKQTDPAEKQKRLASAVEDYQKAIDIKKGVQNDKDPNATKNLAAYYNNLAEAYAKSNKVDDAVKTYALAAQADPANAAQYYFNTGAVLTNAGKVDDALAAFDKVIAADPDPRRCLLLEGREHDRQGDAAGGQDGGASGNGRGLQEVSGTCNRRAHMRTRRSRC